jgi:hypothetical protein
MSFLFISSTDLSFQPYGSQAFVRSTLATRLCVSDSRLQKCLRFLHGFFSTRTELYLLYGVGKNAHMNCSYEQRSEPRSREGRTPSYGYLNMELLKELSQEETMAA